MHGLSNEVGRLLKDARMSLNDSIDDLAEACRLTTQDIIEVENGTTVHLDYGSRIALALGVRLG